MPYYATIILATYASTASILLHMSSAVPQKQAHTSSTICSSDHLELPAATIALFLAAMQRTHVELSFVEISEDQPSLMTALDTGIL
jgi:hypothetical protein